MVKTQADGPGQIAVSESRVSRCWAKPIASSEASSAGTIDTDHCCQGN